MGRTQLPPRVARLLLGLLALSLVSGCTTAQQQRRQERQRTYAFISYWPPAANGTGLRLAVKDLIDMKGVVTSAGSAYIARTNPPAPKDAECLAIARERNVRIVGKTNLTEFAVTVSGKNPHFGTPINRWDGKHKVIPGGSSSGAAVAVATGLADVSFGTDTGGSVRIPAACCGVFGLKTTFGLVSTEGVFPVSPRHLDTVGPMARDLPHLVQGMDLLERGFAARYARTVAAHPSARRLKVGRLYIDGTNPAINKAIDDALAAAGFQVVSLSRGFKAKWAQAERDGETVALGEAWLNNQHYVDKPGVGITTRLVLAKGELDYRNGYREAVRRKTAWQRELRRVFDRVDFIATPTLQTLPPPFPFWGSSVEFEWLVFNSQNTVAVNFAGNPALAMPIPMRVNGDKVVKTSLQLVGPRLSEASLLNAGRLIASKH